MRRELNTNFIKLNEKSDGMSLAQFSLNFGGTMRVMLASHSSPELLPSPKRKHSEALLSCQFAFFAEEEQNSFSTFF